MASPYTLGIALAELVKAEREAIRAQARLVQLTAFGAATDADRQQFTAIAASLFSIESGLYIQLAAALNTFPDAVANPILEQIPEPVILTTPAPPSGAKNPIAVPPALVWAAVVVGVLLAVVVAVAVVWTISITADTIAGIILTWEQANVYADALQRRVACVQACQRSGQALAACTSSCVSSVVLPAPPTPPTPPSPPNPNLPYWIGGTLVGLLGLAGIGLYALERKRRGG